MAQRSQFVQNLLEQINSFELINSFYPLEKVGIYHKGWHSIHESESKQSLVVWPDGNWYCYNCKRGGTIIDLVMIHSDMNVGEAIGWLCDKHGIRRQEWTPDEKAAYERRRHEQQMVEMVLMEAAAYYHQRLTDDHRAYFHGRGLTDETINTFQLGYADGTFYHAIKNSQPLHSEQIRKLNHKDLLLSGLFVKFDSGTIKDSFERRYIFPYWRRGKVAYLIGRRDTDDEAEIRNLPTWNQPKYRKLPTYDEKERPYISQEVQNETFLGEDSIYENPEGIITEGVVDCLVALQAGFSCISPATTGFRQADFPKLAKLTRPWETVYIINDNDENESGKKGALATAQYLFEQGRDVRIVELPRPEGKSKVDLADFLNVQEGLSHG